MKAHTHNEITGLGSPARRFFVGMGTFIGLFAGLLFLLRNLTAWVLDVLKAVH